MIFFFCPFSRFLSFQNEKEKRIGTVRFKITPRREEKIAWREANLNSTIQSNLEGRRE
jgi:hypothetical protein